MQMNILDIIPLEKKINIVDLGAADVKNEIIHYKKLEALEICNIIGFDCEISAFTKLKEIKKNNKIYYKDAIGDGEKHDFYSTSLPTCSSILEPNLTLTNHYFHLSEYMQIQSVNQIDTKKLDEVLLDVDVDYIKLDVQGSELMILKNAIEKINQSVIVESEVEFIEQYKNQPLFSDIERFLRSNGYLFHCFNGYGTRSLKPLMKNNPLMGFRQWIWSDAVFMKNFLSKNININLDKMLKMAVILHEAYQSYDCCYSLLQKCEKILSKNITENYLTYLNNYCNIDCQVSDAND